VRDPQATAALSAPLPRALKDAAFAALLSLGLFLPLVGFDTVTNIRNELILQTRFGLLAVIIALIAAASLVNSLVVAPWRARRALAEPKPAGRFAGELAKRFPPIALAFVFVYPALVLTLVGFQGSTKWIDNFGIQILIYVMLGLGLNIVVGLAGLLDLGYVAFYAVGAYSYALLAKTFGLSFYTLLPLAGMLAAFWGILLGFPVLRLRGDYLAIVTLGFGEILPQIARNGDNFFNTGVNVTNGPQGITSMDAIGFGGWLHRNLGLPENYLNAANSDNLFFWTAIALVCFTLFCCLRLRDSRLGRAWIAIREDETAAAAMGVPLMRTKTFAYAIGAFFGGVAGAYYAELTTGANPDSFQFQFSVLILVMVILGGMGNVWGVMFGAAFLAYLDQAGLANTGGWLNSHLGTNFDVQKYEFGIYGVILLVVMLFRPQGLIPEKRHKLEMEIGVSDEYLYDVTAHSEAV
jgi:branched-chain amino acid transport system permease protein